MSHQKPSAAPATSGPRRALRTDFTAQTLKRAAVAKRRATRKQQLLALIKEPFSMKSLKLLRTAPGAALALAIVVTGSVGAYALANWFNSDVTVKQNESVLSVDLSSCKGNLPPGVDGTDRSHVQFKITGNPHISADELEHRLLAECEADAVLDFYQQNPATNHYYLRPGTVKAIDGNAVTLAYLWGGETHEKTFSLAPKATIYKEGAAASLADIRAGDPIVFAVEVSLTQEGVDPFTQVTAIQSIFKTQYDINTAPGANKTGVSGKGFYEESNIMPLDHYNKINN